MIWAIGVTADFRLRPLDTVRAHVCLPLEVLDRGNFESFLYISSTRVYRNSPEALPATETAALKADPSQADDLYGLSKLTAEAICHAYTEARRVRIVRLSNVFGADTRSKNFLSSIIRESLCRGRVDFQTSPDSEKDYIAIHDVVRALTAIALDGQESVYNVASGTNVPNYAIALALQAATGCIVTFPSCARSIRFPLISVERLQREFPFAPSSLLEALPSLISAFRREESL